MASRMRTPRRSELRLDRCGLSTFTLLSWVWAFGDARVGYCLGDLAGDGVMKFGVSWRIVVDGNEWFRPEVGKI